MTNTPIARTCRRHLRAKTSTSRNLSLSQQLISANFNDSRSSPKITKCVHFYPRVLKYIQYPQRASYIYIYILLSAGNAASANEIQLLSSLSHQFAIRSREHAMNAEHTSRRIGTHGCIYRDGKTNSHYRSLVPLCVCVCVYIYMCVFSSSGSITLHLASSFNEFSFSVSDGSNCRLLIYRLAMTLPRIF